MKCSISHCRKIQTNHSLCRSHLQNIYKNKSNRSFYKIQKPINSIDCWVHDCKHKRLCGLYYCQFHIDFIVSSKPIKLREKSNLHSQWKQPKRPSQWMEQILEENFPGMFIFRKIFKSKVFMGAEVDAYYEAKNFVLIIEMDENQHKPPKVNLIYPLFLINKL